jgi:hypothetical protein
MFRRRGNPAEKRVRKRGVFFAQNKRISSVLERLFDAFLRFLRATPKLPRKAGFSAIHEAGFAVRSRPMPLKDFVKSRQATFTA